MVAGIAFICGRMRALSQALLRRARWSHCCSRQKVSCHRTPPRGLAWLAWYQNSFGEPVVRGEGTVAGGRLVAGGELVAGGRPVSRGDLSVEEEASYTSFTVWV